MGVPPEAPALASSATCPAAGYLCAQLSESPTFRIHRWATDRPPLRVRVDLPDHEDPARARELRRAAVRGIQAWQGRPFPLSIEDRDGVQSGREADVHVTWAPRLDGTALGATHTRWEQGPEGATFTSVRVVLATIHPFSGQILLGPDDVELVAAHEMGHALGLPHSDLPQDLMYPTNTALRPSARDYRTLKALYDLPNGATVATNGRSVADD